MATIDSLTAYLPAFGDPGTMVNTLINILIAAIGLGIVFFFFYKVLKYKYPVEIWKFDSEGHFQIVTDVASIKESDGIKKITLAKAKKKQIYNHSMYPIKSGLLKKTKDKIYLTEENGALRGLILQRNAHFFDVNGALLNPQDVYFEDDNGQVCLTEADLSTKDGSQVLIQKVPVLAPANNDSNNAFTLELLEKVTKYHIPQWYEKLQYAAIIMAGIVAALIVFIINKVGT